MMFANRIGSSTSCSIWLPETSPPSSARGLLGHHFQSCNTSLFFHRKFEVPVASLAISITPARTLRSPTARIGTELLANREKIEVTRSGAPFERSPVPMAVRIAAARAQFAHFPEKCLKPETGWRSEPNSNSRFRFLNWQTRAFRRQLQHSDESWSVRGLGAQFLKPPAADDRVWTRSLGSISRQSTPIRVSPDRQHRAPQLSTMDRGTRFSTMDRGTRCPRNAGIRPWLKR